MKIMVFLLLALPLPAQTVTVGAPCIVPKTIPAKGYGYLGVICGLKP